MPHLSNNELGSIGGRLAFIRGSISQRAYADQIGVPLKTYQTYEQGKREPDLRTLTSLHEHGWNLNWVLMGKGAERLDARSNVPSNSRSVHLDQMLIAIQSVESVLREKKLALPDIKKAQAIALVYDLVGDMAPSGRLLTAIDISGRLLDLAQETG